jgi:hypothetical protein
MTTPNDKKMFAPLRHRESITPEAKLCALLGSDGGHIAEDLAESLVHGGFAVGTRALIVQRIGEMLEGLEEAGKVERTPDGRYRSVRRGR